MYYDIIKYFSEIKNPSRGLYYADNNGKIMCININPKQLRNMVSYVTPGGRCMCIKHQMRPKSNNKGLN